MKRFEILEKGEYEEFKEYIEKATRYVLLRDKVNNKIVEVREVQEAVYYGDDCDLTVRIYVSINYSKPEIVYDPIERRVKYHVYPDTRGQRRKAFARIAKSLGVTKKELAMYIGLVSFFVRV